MSERHFATRASFAIFLGCFWPVDSVSAAEAVLRLPPVREVWFGPVPGALLLVIGWLAGLAGVVWVWKRRSGGEKLSELPAGAEGLRALWRMARPELVARVRGLALPWVFVAGCLIWFFGFLSETIDPVTRRPVSGLRVFLDVAAILLCSMLGVLGANAATWCRARPCALAGAGEKEIPGLLAAMGEMLLMIPILLLLPQDTAGPCLVSFAIGAALGTAGRRIGSGSIAGGAFDNSAFVTVSLVALLSVALTFKPAIAATLVVWIFVMRLLMILAPLGASLLKDRIERGPSAAMGAFVHCDQFLQPSRITALIVSPATVVVSWLLLGNSASSGSQAYSGLWWMLVMLVGGGTLAGALVPECAKVFARLGQGQGNFAGPRPALWNGAVVLALLLFAWKASLQPAMARLMPAEIPFAGTFFAFGLVAFGFLALEPLACAAGDNQSAAMPMCIAPAVLGVLATVFVMAMFLESPAASGRAFNRLSLVQPDVMLGLLVGGMAGRWLESALKHGIHVLVVALCFALAVALFSAHGFVACLVAVTMSALIQTADSSNDHDAPEVRRIAVLQFIALLGLLAVLIAAAMKDAPAKARLGWLLLVAGMGIAWLVTRREGMLRRKPE